MLGRFLSWNQYTTMLSTAAPSELFSGQSGGGNCDKTGALLKPSGVLQLTNFPEYSDLGPV